MDDLSSKIEMFDYVLKSHDKRIEHLESTASVLTAAIQENTAAVKQVKEAIVGDDLGRPGLIQAVQEILTFKNAMTMKSKLVIGWIWALFFDNYLGICKAVNSFFL